MAGSVVVFAPAAANAATVKIVKGVVTYQASPGETNRIAVNTGSHSDRPEGLYLDEAKPGQAKASAPCKTITSGVFCAVGEGSKIVAHLGDKNDEFSDEREFEGGSSTVYGEDGNDQFRGPTNEFLSASVAVFYGGSGNDTSYDGRRVFGGLGNDDLSTSSGTPLDGGEGNDTISTNFGDVAAGPGNDHVKVYGDSSGDYPDASGTIDLGSGDDTLDLGEGIFNAERVTPFGTYSALNGGEGAIHGGSGRDVVNLADAGRPLAFDLSAAPTSLEVVKARPDTAGRLLIGSSAPEVFRGGDGPDIIIPGVGKDWVRAAGGNDTIITGDGALDHIDCGAGNDFLVADAIDVREGGCE